MDNIVTNKKRLSMVSIDVTVEEIREMNLKQRLKEAMKNAWTPGYGLAAIQIDVPVNYAWFHYLGKEYELINPKITMEHGRQTIYREGCLSIPGKYINTVRAYKIEYMSNGKKYRAKGTKAAIIQHEIDHMFGILNTEREMGK